MFGSRHAALSVMVTVLAATAGACASGPVAGGGPAAFPGAPRPAWTMDAPLNASDRVTAVLDTALALKGSRYQWGGGSPNVGFDCSGFVQYVLSQHRVFVPRTVAEQFRVGEAVDLAHLTPGDLIFFSTTAPGATHVGFVVDNQSFVHAPDTGSVVRVDRFDSPYWRSRVTGVRRVALNGPES